MVDRNKLIKQIREVLMTEIPLDKVATRVERLVNAPIPGTPRLSGRGIGARVMYVCVPGRGKNRAAIEKATESLTARAAEGFKILMRKGQATSADIQQAMKVNRNVVAGMLHEWKRAGLVSVQAIETGGASFQAAAGFRPSGRASSNESSRKRKAKKQ